MEVKRKPFQGVFNIVRFNWHFYVLSLIVFEVTYFLGFHLLACLAVAASILSLLVSWYIYDLSGLYNLNWVNRTNAEQVVVNIHAGFDETSSLLKQKFNHAALRMIDFYDPQKHTEVSIKRARKAYPVHADTIKADAGSLPIADASVDKVFVIFSAHEIRDEVERLQFIQELTRIIKPGGEIYITEHLRDTANFIVYNIGFFHFYTRGSWLKLFKDANLRVNQEVKLTPFISTFIISRNDSSF
jgi:SAM-dependent methyltransferase